MEPASADPKIKPAMLVSNETMEAVVRRVAERRRGGARPPGVMLPMGKDAFPKLVNLDLNQWIYREDSDSP